MARCGCGWSYGKRVKRCVRHKDLKGNKRFRRSRAKYIVSAKKAATKAEVV